MKLYVGSFLVGMVATSIGLYPGLSQAAWKRVESFSCRSESPLFAQGDGVSHNSSSDRYLFCSFEEADTFTKTSVTSLNLHGRDRSTARGARGAACVTLWSTSAGGICGTYQDSGNAFTGEYGLTPSLSIWSNPIYGNDFAYVSVIIPPYDAVNGMSTFRGYSVIKP
jgi:hypothetical protein